jgi:hypothetical protein
VWAMLCPQIPFSKNCQFSQIDFFFGHLTDFFHGDERLPAPFLSIVLSYDNTAGDLTWLARIPIKAVITFPQ